MELDALELLTQFKKGLDLLMLKFLDLYAKGLQSCWLLNFENDRSGLGIEPWLNALASRL